MIKTLVHWQTDMFVSIPSFRDENVLWTVQDCVEKALAKDKLVIVVCEQNKDERSCIDLVDWAASQGVRLVVETLDWRHA
jgi:hypothetical protein